MSEMGAIKSVGRVRQYMGEGDPICGDSVIRIRANPEIVDPRYLLYALDSPNLRDQILRIIYFSTVCQLKIRTIRELVIPVPPLDVQRTIVQTMDNIDTALAENIALMLELVLKGKTYRRDTMGALFPKCS